MGLPGVVLQRIWWVWFGLLSLQHPHLARADETPHLKINGYLEAYYQYDANQPGNRSRPDFIYNHTRTQQPAVNLALISAHLDSDKLRANLGIAIGDYMQANYAAEPNALSHLFEANIGIKLAQAADLWLDIGVMPSHIGFESAIGANNWTLTRSLMADNSPYFETGAKLSYTSEDKTWFTSVLLLNGWQRIQRANNSTVPALGHQITYQPNDRLTINSSSFIGNDKSDRDRQMRYFHNLYAQIKLDDAWSLIAGLDVGIEQKARNSSAYNRWHSPVVIVKYQHNEQLSFVARVERYRDKDGVIIATDTPNGFDVRGVSVNTNVQLTPHSMWRLELKHFSSRDELFRRGTNRNDDESFSVTTALTFGF